MKFRNQDIVSLNPTNMVFSMLVDLEISMYFLKKIIFDDLKYNIVLCIIN